jgi:hypothetical protein
MKMKTLDEIVVFMSGKWPTAEECSNLGFVTSYELSGDFILFGTCPVDRVKFQQRAKELGFVGRYRWGIEYATDGKRPELPNDVVVDFKNKNLVNTPWQSAFDPTERAVKSIGSWNCDDMELFKITDQRYKPADTSYLDKPDSSLDNGADWYCYETQKALRLPPVGVEVIGFIGTGFKLLNLFYVGKNSRGSLVVEDESGEFKCFHEHQINFKPLDHDRKAKAERSSFVSAGCKVTDDLCGVFTSDKAAHDVLCALYDAGFRLTESQK